MSVHTMMHPYVEYTSDGQFVAHMRDRNGHEWATGKGTDRVQALYEARKKLPRTGVIRGLAQWAMRNPGKAALATTVVRYAFDSGFRRSTLGEIIGFAIFTYIAYVAAKRFLGPQD